MNSVFSAPELAYLIACQLDRDDLQNCVRVNSTWRNTFTPNLWNTIESTLLPPFSEEQRVISEVEKQAFIANNRHIRTIRSNNSRIVNLALENCTHLRRIEIWHQSRNVFSTEFVLETFIPAMKRNQSVEALVYKEFPASESRDIEPIDILKQTFEPMLCLTYLYITFNISLDRDVFLFLESFAVRQLHTFVVALNMVNLYRGTEGQGFEHAQAELAQIAELGQSKLRSLSMRTSICMQERSLILPLLKASPNLELEFPSFHQSKAEPIAEAIRENCPKLCDLDLKRTRLNLNDDKTAVIIRACKLSGLRSIRIHREYKLGPASVKALCEYNTTLKSVTIPAYGPGSVKAVLHLLTSCPNLRVLEATTAGCSAKIMGKFKAKELLQDRWVCVNLETLSLPFVGVYSDGDVENINEQSDWHQELYSQLSRLSGFQRLNVGFKNRSGIKSKTSPKFSLQSGLAALAGLKSLRELDLSFTRANVGKVELEWMADN